MILAASSCLCLAENNKNKNPHPLIFMRRIQSNIQYSGYSRFLKDSKPPAYANSVRYFVHFQQFLERCALQKRSKDFKGLQRIGQVPKYSWPAGDLLGPGAPHEPIFVGDLLRIPSWPPGALGESSLLVFEILLFYILGPGSLRSSKFMCDTKPKEVLWWVLAPMQSFDPWISSAMAMAMSIYSLCSCLAVQTAQQVTLSLAD